MGAPEAVLVGVVALIVFGPKGLAEVRTCHSASLRNGHVQSTRVAGVLQAVKSLGGTLRAFQPTIKEILSVSSDLKSTLEEQIGLDDIRSELQSSVAPQPRPRLQQAWHAHLLP